MSLAAERVPLATWSFCSLLGRAHPESTSHDVSQCHVDSHRALSRCCCEFLGGSTAPVCWRKAAFDPAGVFLLALKPSTSGSGGGTDCSCWDGQQQNLVGQLLILLFQDICGEMGFKRQFSLSAGVKQLALSVGAGAVSPFSCHNEISSK